MVDSISSISQIGNVSSANDKIQKTSKPNDVKDIKHIDEVNISVEALSLADIEKVAKEASNNISHDISATLSSDIEKLSLLV